MDPDMSGADSSVAGAGLSIGIAGAQGFMNPVSDMMAVGSLIGVGMSLFGSNKAAQAASQIAADSSAIAGLDVKVNQQRQQQMVLQASRQQLENVRNTQKARSLALSGAVNQGAQFGSGLPGGMGQIGAQGSTNAVNTSQNLQIGQNIFGYDSQIDQYREQIAQLQGTEASGQGTAALGAAVGKSTPALANLFGNFFPAAT